MESFNTNDGRPGDSRAFVHKRIGGAFTGFLGGGLSGGISGFLGGGRQTLPQVAPHRNVPTPFSNPRTPTPGFIGGMERLVPGGASGYTEAPVVTHRGGSTGIAVNAGQCAPAGFHKAKSTYVRKIDPCAPYQLGNLEVVPAGTFVEGSARRKNPSNGKANSNAIRRLKGAEGTAVKLLKAVGYKSVTKNARRTR